jgi:ATP-dependent exoDNAse (exonuclease V) beta subunit
MEKNKQNHHKIQQRFLYVAMTRASDVLILTYSKETESIKKGWWRVGCGGEVNLTYSEQNSKHLHCISPQRE